MKTLTCTQLPPEELFGAAEQLLQDGYDASFTVTGNSMWPFLAHGRDQVTLHALGDRPVKTGDILLFCPEEERYLLHRVLHTRGGVFRTAGDSNCFFDGTFSVNCVIGRVTAFSRKGRPVSCEGIAYRLCSRVWMWLFPVRRPLLRLLRTAAKQKSRLS